MRRRIVREEERELWANFARSVTPLAPAGTPKIPARKNVTTPQQEAARSDAERVTELARPEPKPPRKTGRKPAKSKTVHEPVPPLSSEAMSFLTVGEMAIAAHLRNRVIKRKGRPPQADAILIGTRQTGLDTGSWKRLARGQTAAERRLDLHGMTAQAAFMRLREFLVMSHREGVRCVEVVTGLGSGPEGGILRRELPFWLGRDDLRRLVLAVTHSHGANQGAVRVLLRRRTGVRR
ncbi:Smr/MutS family protein [Acetobacter fallax]